MEKSELDTLKNTISKIREELSMNHQQKFRFILTGFTILIFLCIQIFGIAHSEKNATFASKKVATKELTRIDEIWSKMLASHTKWYLNFLSKNGLNRSDEKYKKRVVEAILKSAMAWKRVIINLPKVKIGDSRDTVIALLGNPADGDFIPKKILQYSVDAAIRPEGDDGKYVRISLDEENKVEKIERTETVYGPPPG